MARHVRKGDTVIVRSGDHKGAVGEIIRVITKSDSVIIKGVNLRTKHLRPTRINPQGGIVTREASIHISNVSPVVDGKPSRVRFVNKPDGSKVRVAVRGGGCTAGHARRCPGGACRPGRSRHKLAHCDGTPAHIRPVAPRSFAFLPALHLSRLATGGTMPAALGRGILAKSLRSHHSQTITPFW